MAVRHVPMISIGGGHDPDAEKLGSQEGMCPFPENFGFFCMEMLLYIVVQYHILWNEI